MENSELKNYFTSDITLSTAAWSIRPFLSKSSAASIAESVTKTPLYLGSAGLALVAYWYIYQLYY